MSKTEFDIFNELTEEQRRRKERRDSIDQQYSSSLAPENNPEKTTEPGHKIRDAAAIVNQMKHQEVSQKSGQTISEELSGQFYHGLIYPIANTKSFEARCHQDSAYSLEQSEDKKVAVYSLKDAPENKVTITRTDKGFFVDASAHSKDKPTQTGSFSLWDSGIVGQGNKMTFNFSNGKIIDFQSHGYSEPMRFKTCEGELEFDPKTGNLNKVPPRETALPSLPSTQKEVETQHKIPSSTTEISDRPLTLNEQILEMGRLLKGGGVKESNYQLGSSPTTAINPEKLAKASSPDL